MRTSFKCLLLLTSAVAVALCTASSASAANVVPNPSFEDECGSATKACYWPEVAEACCTAFRDISLASTGNASYRIEGATSDTSVDVFSECMPVALVAGNPSYSFAYRTEPGANVGFLQIAVFPWPNATCSEGAAGANRSPDAINDGEWHTASGTIDIFSDGQAMTVKLGFHCNGACAGAEVNFDDLVLEQDPTSVRITSTSAKRTPLGAVLRWQTANETQLLGFNVYRQQQGKLVKLNRALIPSVFGGTATGHSYSWLDRTAPKGAKYRLQAVSLSGKRTWVGSAIIAR